MAKKEELFWLGAGVIRIQGKHYGAGKPLPVDKLDKGVLARLIKKGKIGEIKQIVKVDPGKKLNAANAKIAELEEEVRQALSVVEVAREECNLMQDTIAELEAQIVALTPNAKEPKNK